MADAPRAIWIVCAEESGDLHASLLARELRRRRPDLPLRAAGGDHLRAAGAEVVFDTVRHAVVGLIEVLGGAGRILALRRDLLRHILAERPQRVILVDAPDFNLPLAEKLRRAGIPVTYYISPQVWAWRSWRARQIARCADQILCIFPFEETFYRRHGVTARFVGHPLVDLLDGEDPEGGRRLRADLGVAGGRLLAGILPGSRAGECARILPVLLQAAARMAAVRHDLAFAVGFAPRLPHPPPGTKGMPLPPVVRGRTHDLMRAADVLLTASGTATLEAAVIGTPMVVVYRLDPITWLIGRPWIHVPFCSMANLIAGREVVPERVQGAASPGAVARAALRLLEPDHAKATRRALEGVRSRLSRPGAAARAAGEVLQLIPPPGG